MPLSEPDNPALIMIKETRGLAVKVGKELGITRSAVWMWKRVPPEHAVKVGRMLKIPVHKVCPGIFPPPAKVKKKKSTTRKRVQVV